MNEHYSAPIAIFAYNRPHHLQITLDALARADSFDACPLRIFCDAGEDVAPTRRVAHDFVHRHGGKVIERSKSMSYRNIVEGVTEVCQEYGRVIVIEDDIVISPDFLTYSLTSLDRYERESQVYLISGQMYADIHAPHPPTFFLPTTLIWGWATWWRAWSQFTWDPPDWQSIVQDPKRRSRFNLGGSMPFSIYLDKAMTGRINSWAIRWACTVFNHNGLGLYPWRSLTWNTGIGSGVHGLGSKGVIDHRVDFIHGRECRESFGQPRMGDLVFPEAIQTDEQAYRRMATSLKRSHRWWRQIRRGLVRSVDLVTAKWNLQAS